LEKKGRPERAAFFYLVEVVGMDSPLTAAHRFAARCARPDRASPRSVNPLRGFSSVPLPAKPEKPPFGGFLVLVEVV